VLILPCPLAASTLYWPSCVWCGAVLLLVGGALAVAAPAPTSVLHGQEGIGYDVGERAAASLSPCRAPRACSCTELLTLHLAACPSASGSRAHVHHGATRLFSSRQRLPAALLRRPASCAEQQQHATSLLAVWRRAHRAAPCERRGSHRREGRSRSAVCERDRVLRCDFHVRGVRSEPMPATGGSLG